MVVVHMERRKMDAGFETRRARGNEVCVVTYASYKNSHSVTDSR
jgi:hypothetical protein